MSDVDRRTMERITARDIMKSPVTTVSPTSTLEEAATLMITHSVDCLPVVDGDGKVVGVLTETDYMPKASLRPMGGEHLYSVLGRMVSTDNLEKEYRSAASREVRDAMSGVDVPTFEGTASLSTIIEAMVHYKVHHVLILRNERLIGLVSSSDLMKLVSTKG
jgi:CBS domain-containing protein